MREFDEQEYANLVKERRVVDLGKAPPLPSPRSNPLSAIRDAISGSGITEAIRVLASTIVNGVRSADRMAQNRNDILANMAATMQVSDVKEWTFTIERDDKGFIKEIKARRG